ncbi:MAG TPA: hypothetical protein VI796_00490 [Candidatus Thermoplasmatota archaeon]|nr:hypothetical protein [Candidatus Thermoplasmatota archaeon]
MARKLCLVLAGVMLLLAGCSSAGAEAAIEFDGTGNGAHSDRGDCGDSGTLSGDGKVHDGQVTVRVQDADGTELFVQSYSEDFELDGEHLSGDAGDWTLRATRDGNDVLGDTFGGSYDLALNC